MNFTRTLKTTAAAAALLGLSSAFAANLPVSLVNGSSTLTVSSSANSTLGAAGVSFSAAAGSTSSQSGSSITQAATSIVSDATNSAITGISFLGSSWMLQNGSQTITINYTNASADLSSNTIYADVTDSLGSLSHLDLFQANAASGSNALPAGLTGGQTASINTTLSGLYLTTDSATRFASAAGLGTSAGMISYLKGIDFGTLSISANVSANVAAVPEPSTYAMVSLGLLAVGAVARRRNQAAA